MSSGMFTDGSESAFLMRSHISTSPEERQIFERRYKAKAKELFTPGKIASGDMYIERDDNSGGEDNSTSIETQVEDALTSESFQILLFGDSGVGKTNILIHLAERNSIDRLLVNIREQDSVTDVIERAIKRLDGPIMELTERVASAEISNKGSLGHSSISVSHGSTNQESLTFSAPPTDRWEALSELMISKNIDLLILDNLQNMRNSEERSKLGSLMEYFYDLRAEFPEFDNLPKIAAAGIASNGEDLIAQNDSRHRRIRQIHVSHMADEKIGKIAETGFGILKQKIDRDARELIEFYSDGFPFFAHDLCLAITKLEDIYLAETIELIHVQRATEYLSASELDSMRSLLHAARGKQSEVRVRANVLDIIAASNWSSWTSRLVHDEWQVRFPNTKTRQSDITNALNELSGEAAGFDRIAMLTRTGKGSSGFTYRFRNPHLRPYIRMHPEVR